MTAGTPGDPLVDPPPGPPVPVPVPTPPPEPMVAPAAPRMNRRYAGLAAVTVVAAGLVTWAAVGADRATAPDAVIPVGSVATFESPDEIPRDENAEDRDENAEDEDENAEDRDENAEDDVISGAVDTVAEPTLDAGNADSTVTTAQAPLTTLAPIEGVEPESDAGDDVEVAATDEAADTALEELQELQDAADRLDEADDSDVVVLSLPSGEPADVGALQPLTATIRGENVYLEGAAPSADVGGDYERQAREIWGDKVIARYSIDSSAPDPQADDVLLEKPVLFEPGSATIDPEYTPVLDACFEFLTTYPSVVMIVEGHTDDVGSEEYNLDLAARRADAIVDYYESLGLQPDRLVTVAAGENSPLADNETDAGREQNRRIDLSLVGALVAAGNGGDAEASSEEAAADDTP